MPAQKFQINTDKAYAGIQYGLATTNSQRLTYSTESAMTTFGLGVVQGSKEKTCKLGQNEDGTILGITMRQDNIESATRPGDGTVGLKVDTPMGVMIQGPINIKVKTAVAGKEIGMNPETGEFGGVDATYILVTNLEMLEYPLAAGEVGGVMINVFPK